MVWGIFGAFVGLFLLAMLFQRFRTVHTDHDSIQGLDFSTRVRILDAPIPDIAKEAILSHATPVIRKETSAVDPILELEDDPRLRIFDEL
jgi:hypothetical protein